MALEKAKAFCAYQERSQEEVRKKLNGFGLEPEVVEHHIASLITEGFLNEERFSRSYARGKFRIRKWGKNKILSGLRVHKVSPYCIKAALSEIDEDEYRETLKTLIAAKLGKAGKEISIATKGKLYRFVLGKGFEPELIFGVFKELNL